MKLSYNPTTHRRCIACPNNGQPPLREILGSLDKLNAEGTFVVLECGHLDGSIDEFRELHPEWTWDA